MTGTQTAIRTTQVYRLYIKATPQAIWDAVTKPEWTKQYGYPGYSEYELRKGGAYRAFADESMKANGAPDIIVEGEVIEVDPPHKLVHSWHMLWDPALVAEGFTQVTWEIEQDPFGLTRLTVTHDVEGAPASARQLSGENLNAGGGWSFILSDLKTLLETGKPLAA